MEKTGKHYVYKHLSSRVVDQVPSWVIYWLHTSPNLTRPSPEVRKYSRTTDVVMDGYDRHPSGGDAE